MTDGRAGSLRVGLGSTPAALLMTPILHLATKGKPSLRVGVSHGDSDQLLHGLRNRRLDALVVELRSLKPASDLSVTSIMEMRGAFLCRPGHLLTRERGSINFEAISRYPIASTLLDDEIARRMIEVYGPRAHPEECISLHSNDFSSLLNVVRESDAILMAVRRVAPDLHALPVKPAMNVVARFGLVTLANRTEAPALPMLRKLLTGLLVD